MALPLTAEKPAKPLLTYEEYLSLPEMRQRYEIIEGEMIMCPSPTSDHQWISGEIYEPLKRFVRERQLGVVLYAPLDVIIQKEPRLHTRQPDILFLSAARSGVQGREKLREMPLIETAPDLAVELLSPEEKRRELGGKLADYTAIGVLEVWIVSPEAETVEVLALQEGRYVRAGLYGRGDFISSTVLAEFALAVDAIFA